MQSWYFSPIFENLAGTYGVVTLLALLLLGAWTLAVLFTRLTRLRRWTLCLLRLLVVVLLIAAMLRPTLVYTDVRPQPATIVVLIDASRSMLEKDAFGGRTRWQALRAALDESEPALKKLLAIPGYELKVYAFDAEAKQLELDGQRIVLDAAPTGDWSAYGAVMQDVLRREHNKRLLGLVLMGDGALNTVGTSVLPQSVARDIGRQGTPLFVVPFGQRAASEQPADVAVESISGNITVFAKNEFAVTGTVRIWGYVNRNIPLQMLVAKKGDQPAQVAAATVQAKRDGDQLRYELRYTPQEPGEYEVIVRAPPQEGEKATDNNAQSTFVEVKAGGLKVLYLEGELRPEQRFLRRALSSFPDIQVTLKWIRPPTTPGQWPLRTIDGLPVADYFQSTGKNQKYDVIVIGDLDSDVFRPDDWGALKQAVLQGTGLLMLGGWQTYWPGGYQKTPLADIIPIEFDARVDNLVRQRFGEAAAKDYHLAGPQPMRPADPLGQRHFVMQLTPGAANAAAWNALPALNGANRFRGVSAGAIVLAENGNGDPLLVAAEPKGRVLAFAGDSTWLWAMGGQGDAHRRFWRQVVLWLAGKDKATEDSVSLALDRRTFMPGERVRFTASAHSQAGAPLPDAQITAQLVLPGAKRPLTLRRSGDEMEGEITERLPPGGYSIVATGTAEGRKLKPAEARFVVTDKDLETAHAMADPALLRNLAEATQEQGGKEVMPELLPKLFDEIAAHPVQSDTEVRLRQTLYDQWYAFLAVVGTMCVEWFLRKRWRLV